MVELADSADCNMRKRTWLSYGFKDVTPIFGSKSSVPSINGAVVPQGCEMLKKLAKTAADWYMLSGHHGALYGRDYGLFTTDGQPPNRDMSNVDPNRVANEEQYCGFFN